MGHPLGEAGGEQDAGYGLAPQGELNLRPGKPRPVHRIPADGLLELGEAPRGVVEIRNGVVQRWGGQIHEQSLEVAEGPSRLIGLVGRLDGFVGARFLDEEIGAPVIAGVVSVKDGTVARRDEGQSAAAEVRLVG